MAATKKMTKTTPVVSENKIDVKEEQNEIVFEKTDLIPCRSITNGLLLVDGVRSGELYRWPDYGEVVDIEYQDLQYMINSKNAFLYFPRFIIENEDVIEKNPRIAKLYESLYSLKDFDEILDLSGNQMKQVVESLPDGVRESFKGYVASKIMDGDFDSVSKIKLLDEMFGTKLLLTLAQN